jgi:two-component system, response regulator
MNKKIILIVEDNPTDEFLAKRALMKINSDYKVEVAHDGVEALDYLFNQEETSRWSDDLYRKSFYWT